MRLIAVATTVLSLCLVLLGGATAGAATTSPPLRVTFVARACPAYTDVYANRARNNIMESLQNLGGDSPYPAGQEVLPTLEDVGTQLKCTPLTGWKFTMGTGYVSRADSGAWGKLSKVTNPYAGTIETEASVPLPNVMGGSTGMSIKGATTVELTDAQAKLVASSSKLWVQSGTPGDPLLTSAFGARYGFAALRCAVDNLNGDNVEWVRVPTGHTDVFCYAYLVDQTPQSGTITVVKKVQSYDGSTQVQQTASFSGSVSYNPGGLFSLAATTAAPASVDFVRDAVAAGGAPWSIIETPQSGWTLSSASCVSSTGKSAATTHLVNSASQAGSAEISLAGGDHVTCTFTNSTIAPAPSVLTLTKTTVGNTGSFPVTVRADGATATQSTTVATAVDGVPGAPAALMLATAGLQHVSESLPLSSLGQWRLTAVVCDGKSIKPAGDASFDITVAAGTGAACSLTNTFTPNGAITLRKSTTVAAGKAGFVVTSLADSSFERTQSARTAEAGPAGTALAMGESLTQLPLGTYVISETADAYVGTNEWMLESVVCDGTPIAFQGGEATVTLTPADPRIDCTFTNALIDPAIIPSVPIVPAGKPTPYTPSGPGSPTTPIVKLGKAQPLMGPIADVAIRVRATPAISYAGRVVSYAATARNNGPYAARNVTVVFGIAAAARPTLVTPSQGTCRRTGGMITCSIGTLMPGDVVTFAASRAVTTPGAYELRGVIGTSTEESKMTNNASQARFKVIDPEPVTG